MIYCPVKGGACHQNIVHLSARSGQCGCCGANALGDRSRSDFWPFVLFGCEVLLGVCCPGSPLGEHLENARVVWSSGLGQGMGDSGSKSRNPVLVFLGNS